jgi:hypothetical protein
MDRLLQGLRGLLIDDLRDDIRFAFRSLKKHALLSTTVVITLAFGLGLNTGVFTLINAALFRAQVDEPTTQTGLSKASLACPTIKLFSWAPGRCENLLRGMTCGQRSERVLPLRFELPSHRAISFPSTDWSDLNWAGFFIRVSVPPQALAPSQS